MTDVKNTNRKPTGQTVLLAEDSTVQRLAIAALLEKHGYSVVGVPDGTEALHYLETVRDMPVLVLTDIGMPRMNGINLCRNIKARPLMKDLPVVMLTVLDDDRNQRSAIEAGADEFLAKPVTEMELVLRLQSVLSLERLRTKSQVDWSREVLDALPDGVLVADGQHRYVHSNRALHGLLGFTRDEVVKLDTTLLAEPQAWIDTIRLRLRESGSWHGRVQLKHKEGRKVPVDVRAAATQVDGKALYVVQVRETS